ncbi:CesD/SycD/LcrH family type III secretion system chaperone [Chitinimonas arctica]|uniref:CesD/SycD/LcrH family type III secretion system chaperone n=2 Tax=Chitinimonas arctica TaxID=2594795 RepID=A0A516SLX2_9NEIS|nr:CesD/SycD/LcrH family type III secretion system chaperone [Chitinimonas arctica]
MDVLGAQPELERFFTQGHTIKARAGLDTSDLDTLYAYGYQLFEAGEYKEALQYFSMLAQMDFWSFDYWLAVGICYQRLGQHEEAIFCFSRAGFASMQDPRSSYYAGISYQLLGNIEYARKAFDASLNWCGVQPQYEPLRNHITRALSGCTEGANHDVGN